MIYLERLIILLTNTPKNCTIKILYYFYIPIFTKLQPIKELQCIYNGLTYSVKRTIVVIFYETIQNQNCNRTFAKLSESSWKAL